MKAKAPRDMQRPNRRLGDVIRALVGCPICRLTPDTPGVQLRVIAYRAKTVRLCCPLCGLRFSATADDLVAAISREPGSWNNAMATAIYLRHEEA